MLAIFGANGMWSRAVARLLLSTGRPFRVICHSFPRAPLPSPAAYVHFDQGDWRALLDGLNGVRSCFILSPCNAEQSKLERRYLAAARLAGVRRIVKASGLGADMASAIRMLRWSGEAEQQVRDQAISWTIIRPNFFIQNLTRNDIGIKDAGDRILPVIPAPISMCNLEDIAAVTVRALQEDTFLGRSLDLTGPELLTTAAALARVAPADSRSVDSVRLVPIWEYMCHLRRCGRLNDTNLSLLELYEHMGASAVFRSITSTLAEILDRRPLDE